jgi:hypothetical protein
VVQTPDEIIDDGFREVARRLARLRLGETALVDMSDTSYPTYWRCRPRAADGHTPANINSRKRCLLALERALDAYEANLKEASSELA